MLPKNFVKYIYHVRCSHDLHSIIQSGLIAGGKDARKVSQTVFFTAVDPMHEHLTKEQHYDVTQPRVVPYMSKWKVHLNAVYWVNLPVAQKKGLTFYQTQSNAIILQDSVPADCIEYESKGHSVRKCIIITSSATKDCSENSLASST